MSYQAIEGVARYDNQERVSTESRWQQYLEMRSRNNKRLDETNQSESKEFKNQTSEEADENMILFERPNQQNLEALVRKANRGENLTPSEKAYLQQYDPQTYRKVAEREQELKEYKRILKEAKTHQDVRNAMINHAAVAHRGIARYAESAAVVDGDYLLDEEKSTYDRVV